MAVVPFTEMIGGFVKFKNNAGVGGFEGRGKLVEVRGEKAIVQPLGGGQERRLAVPLNHVHIWRSRNPRLVEKYGPNCILSPELDREIKRWETLEDAVKPISRPASEALPITGFRGPLVVREIKPDAPASPSPAQNVAPPPVAPSPANPEPASPAPGREANRPDENRNIYVLLHRGQASLLAESGSWTQNADEARTYYRTEDAHRGRSHLARSADMTDVVVVEIDEALDFLTDPRREVRPLPEPKAELPSSVPDIAASIQRLLSDLRTVKAEEAELVSRLEVVRRRVEEATARVKEARDALNAAIVAEGVTL